MKDARKATRQAMTQELVLNHDIFNIPIYSTKHAIKLCVLKYVFSGLLVES